MTRTPAFYIDRALDAFNAGFSSKSGKQSALVDLNSAYELIRREFHSAMVANAPALPVDGSFPDARIAYLDAREVPFDLYHVRDRHLVIFADNAADAGTVTNLVELRATIKGAPVNAPVRAEKSERVLKVERTVAEFIERRKAQYATAIDLGELFGRMPVSASTHYVTNDHGTTFLRTFYYLAGKLTPLMVLCAAAEELERREESRAA